MKQLPNGADLWDVVDPCPRSSRSLTAEGGCREGEKTLAA